MKWSSVYSIYSIYTKRFILSYFNLYQYISLILIETFCNLKIISNWNLVVSGSFFYKMQPSTIKCDSAVLMNDCSLNNLWRVLLILGCTAPLEYLHNDFFVKCIFKKLKMIFLHVWLNYKTSPITHISQYPLYFLLYEFYSSCWLIIYLGTCDWLNFIWGGNH